MADNLPLTRKFIRRYGSEVEEEIKSRLKGHGKGYGALYKSIRSEIKETPEGDVILLWGMKDYGKYVDKGVSGWNKKVGSPFSFKKKSGKGTGEKSAFIELLMKWCKSKGIEKGAAFGIRRSIWKWGIAPTQFFTIATKRRAEFFERELEKLMIKDIENVLVKELK